MPRSKRLGFVSQTHLYIQALSPWIGGFLLAGLFVGGKRSGILKISICGLGFELPNVIAVRNIQILNTHIVKYKDLILHNLCRPAGALTAYLDLKLRAKARGYKHVATLGLRPPQSLAIGFAIDDFLVKGQEHLHDRVSYSFFQNQGN